MIVYETLKYLFFLCMDWSFRVHISLKLLCYSESILGVDKGLRFAVSIYDKFNFYSRKLISIQHKFTQD